MAHEQPPSAIGQKRKQPDSPPPRPRPMGQNAALPRHMQAASWRPSNSANDQQQSNPTASSISGLEAAKLTPGMIVYLSPSVSHDRNSMIHKGIKSHEEPWAHSAIISEVNYTSKTAKVYLLTSFSVKSNCGSEALMDNYPAASPGACHARRRYLLLATPLAKEGKYSNPEPGIRELQLDTTNQLPRVSYANVQRTYEVELKHLQWCKNIACGGGLLPASASHIEWAARDHAQRERQRMQNGGRPQNSGPAGSRYNPKGAGKCVEQPPQGVLNRVSHPVA
ncbi:MAG: hypothetical protein Q9159_002257 [Coniocarpon cinnabarinum]